jgi:hypothetical protein
VKFLLRSLVHIYGIGDGIFITDIRTECHPRLVDKLSKNMSWAKRCNISEKRAPLETIPCKSVRRGNRQLPWDCSLLPLRWCALWRVFELHGPSVKQEYTLEFGCTRQRLMFKRCKPALEQLGLPRWVFLSLFEEEKTSASVNCSVSCKRHASTWPTQDSLAKRYPEMSAPLE